MHDVAANPVGDWISPAETPDTRLCMQQDLLPEILPEFHPEVVIVPHNYNSSKLNFYQLKLKFCQLKEISKISPVKILPTENFPSRNCVNSGISCRDPLLRKHNLELCFVFVPLCF